MGRKSKAENGTVLNLVEQTRTDRAVTRQELADAVGVHYQTIGYIERGEYSPSLLLALQIAKVLETKVEDLFWIEG
jgi:DNA-binding XRE family transcriptional regulator